jgi:hypothetical protein
MPELHIITGSNGAGKSSVGPVFLPEHIQQQCEVFNGDKLVEDKKKELYKSGMRAFKEARNIAHEHLYNVWEALHNEHLQNKTNFAYEGHFTNEETWSVPRKFKEAGKFFIIVVVGFAVFLKTSCTLKKTSSNEIGKEQTFYIRTELKALRVANDFKFCDTGLNEEQNCFLRYQGLRYFKKEKIFCETHGKVEKTVLYKSEGTVEYNPEDIMMDSLFAKMSMWKLHDNIIKIKNDSTIYPILGKIVEFDKKSKRIYSIVATNDPEIIQLFIFEFW